MAGLPVPPGSNSRPSEEENASLLENGVMKAVELPAKPKAGVKNAAVRKWLSVSPTGEACLLELAKLRVTHQLGVQLRDLRLLDPQLATSYPSAILARDRALVLNLEFIKCIVTLDAVFLTGLEDVMTLRFVSNLQRRLVLHNASVPEEDAAHKPAGAGPDAGEASASGLASVRVVPQQALTGMHGGKDFSQELPFELRVLEAALEAVSKNLEHLAEELESAAHPALDTLTGKITTAGLERVRRIKSRMVRLNTRVETLREVLEKFLNDDSDMKDLHLTAKEREWQEAQLQNGDSWPGGVTGGGPLDLAMTPGDEMVPDLPVDMSTPMNQAESGPWDLGNKHYSRRASSSSSSSSNTSLSDDEDVATVEMLLEPYFMQLDNTYNKLQTLYEYIDDTEDFINLELDSKRNQIIRMQLILTSFNASVAMVTAFTSLFAMNLEMKPGDSWPGQGPYSWFLIISICSGVGAIGCFLSVMIYARVKRIL